MAPLFALEGVSKRFGDVVALDGVDLALAAGEVVGVLGENGAGKSTLMNVASGLLRPDRGRLVLDGMERRFAGPREAAAAGIGMVHQHDLLVPGMTVTENVMLGDARLNAWRPGLAEHGRALAALAERLGLSLDPSARVETLDVAQRQRVEIVKALHRGARILILDEPTAVLSEPERAQLYAMIRALRRDGTAIVLISHKLDDIDAVCDRVIVLRGGRVVDAAPLAARDRAALVRAMVGGDVSPPTATASRAGVTLLSVHDLAVRRDNGALAFAGVSFDLAAGEILAVAGVDGSGQQELAEAIAGLRPPESGSIALAGVALERRDSPRCRRALGLRHIPHDRLANGVLARRSLADNFLLSHWFERRFRRRGRLDRRAAAAETAAIVRDFDLRGGGPAAALGTLSGGNQQKLVVGRELWGRPRVLIAAHPTRGLDVRTVAALQARLIAARDSGVAVLLISADLGEILQVADRVMALSQGRAHGPLPAAEASAEKVGGWIAGIS